MPNALIPAGGPQTEGEESPQTLDAACYGDVQRLLARYGLVLVIRSVIKNLDQLNFSDPKSYLRAFKEDLNKAWKAYNKNYYKEDQD